MSTGRRDTLWHWRTQHAIDRGEYCYTGGSHVKPLMQIIDEAGRFHGWVGMEASLNQSAPAQGTSGTTSVCLSSPTYDLAPGPPCAFYLLRPQSTLTFGRPDR